MTTPQQPRVAVVQAWAPHYREPFFTLLRERLAQEGVQLDLFHGQPYDENAAKKGAVRIPWAEPAANRVLRVGSRHLTWQSCYRRLRDVDLVICEQASSQLLLYAMWGRYLLRGQRLALWGHGQNFQTARASRSGEALKAMVSRRVHWWFAYTHQSAKVVARQGFPKDRITDVQNAIDTTQLQAAAHATDEEHLAALRHSLGLPSQHVGVYVGAMYEEKRLPFLLEACVALRQLVPDFHMIFVGAGPQQHLVEDAAVRLPWIHHLGAQFGAARVPYFLLADLHLMPGLVGLTLLDSFALRTPLITVADSEHSPEIAYLRDGENGRMLPPGTSPGQYAETVADLLQDRATQQSLSAGCAVASERLTVEAMTERFARGVLAALSAPSRATMNARATAV